jgi:hypothetical protein
MCKINSKEKEAEMKLKSYMKKMKLNLDRVAEQTGIPRSTLGRISFEGVCHQTKFASILITWSNGEITLEDLV